MSEDLSPSDAKFRWFGFFEEVEDADTGKVLGTRVVKRGDGRPLGYSGARVETWTAPVKLTQGHRVTVFRCSPKKPLRVRTTLNALCGRAKVSLSPFDNPAKAPGGSAD